MQVTKGTWRMREQCVPGSLSSSPAREPGNEARYCTSLVPRLSLQAREGKLGAGPGNEAIANTLLDLFFFFSFFFEAKRTPS